MAHVGAGFCGNAVVGQVVFLEELFLLGGGLFVGLVAFVDEDEHVVAVLHVFVELNGVIVTSLYQ